MDEIYKLIFIFLYFYYLYSHSLGPNRQFEIDEKMYKVSCTTVENAAFARARMGLHPVFAT